jgi:hypothetical protein
MITSFVKGKRTAVDLSKKMIPLFLLTLILFSVAIPSKALESTYTEIFSLTGSKVVDVEVFDNILFLVDPDRGLLTYNISNPANPTLLDRCFNSYTFTHSIFIEDTYAYLSDYEDGLEIVDISDPSNLEIIGNYTSGIGSSAGSTDACYSNQLGFLASQNLGLEIINCTSPSNPHKITSYYSNHRIIRVMAIDDLVFLSEAHNGFKVLNITNNFSEIFHFDIDFSIQDFLIFDDLLFVTDSHFGLRIFDIHQIMDITLLCEVGLPDGAYGMRLLEQNASLLLYIAGWEAGTRIYDVTNLDNITFVGEFNDGGRSYDLTLDNNYIFVAEFLDGFEILKFNPVESTTTERSTTETDRSINGFEVLFILLAILLIKKKPKNKL